MKSLFDLVQHIWDGDVTLEEATEGFSPTEIQTMDLTVGHNPDIFDSQENLGAVMKNSPGGRLIRMMINKFETTCETDEDESNYDDGHTAAGDNKLNNWDEEDDLDPAGGRGLHSHE